MGTYQFFFRFYHEDRGNGSLFDSTANADVSSSDRAALTLGIMQACKSFEGDGLGIDETCSQLWTCLKYAG